MRNLDPNNCLPFLQKHVWGPKALRPDTITNEDLDSAMAEAETQDRSSLTAHRGLYLVMNRESRFVYVGRATNMKQRVGIHYSQLKSGSHTNRHWKEDFQRLGAGGFGVATITYTTKTWDWLAELAALELLKKRDCYNVQGIDYFGRANLTDEYLVSIGRAPRSSVGYGHTQQTTPQSNRTQPG